VAEVGREGRTVGRPLCGLRLLSVTSDRRVGLLGISRADRPFVRRSAARCLLCGTGGRDGDDNPTPSTDIPDGAGLSRRCREDTFGVTI